MKVILLTPILTLVTLAVTSEVPEFDLYVFAQLWPTSDCIEWQGMGRKNTCNLPGQHWTVHGIWPTQNGKIGPINCDRDNKFEPKKLDPILGEMMEKWTNVRANEGFYDFWEHEWNKHGTCAAKKPQFGSEIDYFKKGLELHEEYPLYKWLGGAGIEPGSSTTFDAIEQAVLQHTKVRPAIQCLTPKFQANETEKSKNHDLWQIWICLDLNLQPEHCDVIKNGINHNCPKNGEINYPSKPLFKGRTRNERRGSRMVFLPIIIPFGLFALIGAYLYRRCCCGKGETEDVHVTYEGKENQSFQVNVPRV